MKTSSTLLLATAVVSAFGCGNTAGNGRVAVSGRVTLDGQPLEQGSINFFPAAQSAGVVAGANIADGRYTLAAARGPMVGRCRVEIVASKKTGRSLPDVRTPGAMIDEMVSLVPPRYNTQSTLEAELHSGDNLCDFELDSH